MTFFQKLKMKFQKFMMGRNGADQLSLALLTAALVLMLISAMFGSPFINILSLVLYGWCIFRMFSKNISKRYAENVKYVEGKQKIKTGTSQAWARLKNIRKYKYFKCPQCHTMLRLPRKVGEVTVTCKNCHHSFKQKA